MLIKLIKKTSIFQDSFIMYIFIYIYTIYIIFIFYHVYIYYYIYYYHWGRPQAWLKIFVFMFDHKLFFLLHWFKLSSYLLCIIYIYILTLMTLYGWCIACLLTAFSMPASLYFMHCHRCATGESWQQIMRDCLAGRPCDPGSFEPSSDPHARDPDTGCGLNFAYFYFVVFFFLCSFLVGSISQIY